MHELADRIRDHRPLCSMEIKFDGAGFVKAATVVDPDGTRTKIV